MLFGTLGASLLENLLTGKGTLLHFLVAAYRGVIRTQLNIYDGAFLRK